MSPLSNCPSTGTFTLLIDSKTHLSLLCLDLNSVFLFHCNRVELHCNNLEYYHFNKCKNNVFHSWDPCPSCAGEGRKDSSLDLQAPMTRAALGRLSRGGYLGFRAWILQLEKKLFLLVIFNLHLHCYQQWDYRDSQWNPKVRRSCVQGPSMMRKRTRAEK